ncbi:MAG TPA: hypothetical protein PLF03_05950 [Candidatus Omnitrophota bacterium]|nr:hypothetical protein [Candidatus Omnitrophota bacterium]
MRRLPVVLLTIVVAACCGCEQKAKPAIKIGDIGISAAEFNESFSAFRKARGQSADRKEFLDTYVTRKLILIEAEQLGLDKAPQFLQDLQLFWEQSLLKLMLARKVNEVSVRVRVDDKEIEEYYLRHKEKDFPDKELAQVYDQIKILLFKVKQRLAMQRWTDELKKRTAVEIDYKLLNLPEQQ